MKYLRLLIHDIFAHNIMYMLFEKAKNLNKE